MRFAVLGGGSIGLLVGGYLAKSGHHVVQVVKDEQGTIIRDRGIEVTGRSRFKARVEVASRPGELTDGADYLIVAVRGPDTTSALEGVASVEFSSVLSLQNGMTKDTQLAAVFGKHKVIGATIMMGATRLEPGIVEHTMPGTAYFGELDGSPSERVDRLAATFNEAELRTEIPSSILSVEWAKLCHVVPTSLLSALTRLEYYRICQSRDLAEPFVAITRECVAVARTTGVDIQDYPGLAVRSLADASTGDAIRTIVERGAGLEKSGQTNVRISMLRDILSRRRTEIEETAGFVVARAREHDVPVPNVEFGYRVVRALDAYL